MKSLKIFSSIILCCSFLQVSAQKEKASNQGNKVANQIRAAIAETKTNAKYSGYFKTYCNPKAEEKLNLLKPKDLFPDKRTLGLQMDKFRYKMLNHFVNFGLATYEDYLPVEAITKTDNFQAFVKKVYYKEVEQLSEDKIRQVRKRYKILKDLKDSTLDLGSRTLEKGGCSFKIQNTFEPSKWSIKEADDTKNETFRKNKSWISYYKGTLVTRVVINCPCKGKTLSDLKNAIFEYRGSAQFVLDFRKWNSKALKRENKMNFEYIKTPPAKLNAKQILCCEAQDISYDESSIDIENEEIGLLPDQTIGGFVGAGFQENFEETTLCVSAEYLHKITQLRNSPFLVGGTVSYHTTSFLETTTTEVAIGPTVQLFTPVTSNNSIYVANGVSAQYYFGNQDSFGFESNFSGINVLLNAGVHIPLNEHLGISVLVPVVSFQSTTFKPDEEGESFSDSNTGFFMENRNAIKVGLRFGF